jgi:hypothetical protein
MLCDERGLRGHGAMIAQVIGIGGEAASAATGGDHDHAGRYAVKVNSKCAIPPEKG